MRESVDLSEVKRLESHPKAFNASVTFYFVDVIDLLIAMDTINLRSSSEL